MEGDPPLELPRDQVVPALKRCERHFGARSCLKCCTDRLLYPALVSNVHGQSMFLRANTGCYASWGTEVTS